MRPMVLLCPARYTEATALLHELLKKERDLRVRICPACLGGGCPVRPLRPAVVVLPTGLPDDLAHVIETRTHHPDAKLVVLSLYDTPAYRGWLSENGVDRYVPLDLATEQLVPVVHELLAEAKEERRRGGQTYFRFGRREDTSPHSSPRRSDDAPELYRTG